MKKIILLLIALIAISNNSQAQLIEDAVRYTNPDAPISPRVGALGVSYFGISDDGSAIFYNPAGLQFIKKSEVSAGFGVTNTELNSSYGYYNDNNSLGTYKTAGMPIEQQNFHNNSQYLTNFTYVT